MYGCIPVLIGAFQFRTVCVYIIQRKEETTTEVDQETTTKKKAVECDTSSLLLIFVLKNIHNDDEYKQDGGDGAAWACVMAEWWERGDGFGDAEESGGWIVGEEE